MKTEALLKKYLESELTEAERFELEKRALDDDFLASAWEGLQVHQSADKVASWNALKTKWNARQEEKKKTLVISLRRWAPMAVAASVLVLAGTFFWMNPSSSNFDKESSVALQCS